MTGGLQSDQLLRWLIESWTTANAWLVSKSYTSEFRSSESPIGRVALGLYLSDILFMTRFYALSNVVETVLFALFLASRCLRGQFVKALFDPVVMSLMIFFSWTLVSGLWSDQALKLILEDWWGWRKLLLLPIGLVLLGDARSWKLSQAVFLVVGCLFLFLAGYTYWYEIAKLWERPYTHILQNHNAQGIYFSILGAALIVLPRGRSLPLFLKLVSISTGLMLLLFTMWLGSSRSGYVASAVSLAFVGFYWLGGRWLGFLLGLCVAAVLLFSSPMANKRVDQAASEVVMGLQSGGKSSSGSIRVVMWLNTLDIIENHWLIGVGAADFPDAYDRAVADEVGWRKTPTDDPHNQLLHIWAEYGLIGLVMFITFLLAIFFRADLRSAWGVILMATLLISSTVGLFNGVFGSSIEGRILQFTFAICLSGLTYHQNKHGAAT